MARFGEILTKAGEIFLVFRKILGKIFSLYPATLQAILNTTLLPPCLGRERIERHLRRHLERVGQASHPLLRHRRVQGLLLQDEGRLPPVSSRIRYSQRPKRGSRKFSCRVQGRKRHRHDRAAHNSPHPVIIETQIWRFHHYP